MFCVFSGRWEISEECGNTKMVDALGTGEDHRFSGDSVKRFSV